MPRGCIIGAPIVFNFLKLEAQVGCIIIHRRGAFDVARFDRQGNARAFTSWNGQQELAPRLNRNIKHITLIFSNTITGTL